MAVDVHEKQKVVVIRLEELVKRAGWVGSLQARTSRLRAVRSYAGWFSCLGRVPHR